MEFENSNSKQTYINLLIHTLQRKAEVLDLLIVLTRQQEELIKAELFDEEQFLVLMEQKDEQIHIMSNLDSGFEKIYGVIKDELTHSKEFKVEIESMKELILTVTNSSVELQSLELRNKKSLEVLFAKKRSDIKNSRISSNIASNYYKAMSNIDKTDSIFYDKKN